MDASATTPASVHRHGQDRRFVAARRAASPALRAIIAEAIEQAEELERIRGLRQRRRKGDDAAKFALTVEALISDLAERVDQGGHNGRLRVSLGKDYLSHREPPAIGQATRQALDLLASPEIPWLAVEIGSQGADDEHGRETTFAAGPRLLDRFNAAQIGAADTTLCYAGEELIRLRDVPPRRRGDVKRPARKKRYTDTSEIVARRAEMAEINAAHSALCIEPARRPVCFIRRYTHGSFQSGGRLMDAYGAPFWYGLPNERTAEREGIPGRLDLLRIDGEEVGEADISSCGAAILYAWAGAPLPAHDLYTPPEFEGAIRENEDLRDGFKSLFAACTNTDGPLRGWPSKLEKAKRPCADFQTALDALLAHNAPIAHYLQGPIVGHAIQNTDSNIIVRALLSGQHLKAIPLHDCLITPRRHVAEAAVILRQAFRDETGAECVVKTRRALADQETEGPRVLLGGGYLPHHHRRRALDTLAAA